MTSANSTLNGKIRAALSVEAAQLSALALRSKGYWGYDRAFMQACEAELLYSESRIQSVACNFQVYECDLRIAAFYAFELMGGGDAELEALFVDPPYIGKGIGKLLIRHAKEKALEAGIRRIVIQGDPHAFDFYIASGATHIGSRQSGSIASRELPLFELSCH